MSKVYKFQGRISVFNMEDGWHFVAVPPEITNEKKIKEKLSSFKGWKFLPILAKVGKTEWKTALLPLGKHSIIPNQKFIAIKKDVRKKEGLQMGEIIKLSFKIIDF